MTKKKHRYIIQPSESTLTKSALLRKKDILTKLMNFPAKDALNKR